jgi:hypothetical protein
MTWRKPFARAWRFMAATFKTLDALEQELQEMGPHSAEYWAKQVHTVPKSQTVDRTKYLVKHATGKTILHIGCTGQLDKELCKVAKKCYGIDQQKLDRPDFRQCDLDELARTVFDSGSWQTETIPHFPEVELIICGEVLEHLSNPGCFLDCLKDTYNAQPVIFTVPNAMCTGGMEWLVKRGRENVNSDHVCYYSYTTIKTLLARHGYRIERHFWYGGKPYTSEGLIVVALPQKD